MGQFLSKFADFQQILTLSTGKLLVVGDFNIQTEAESNTTPSQFHSLLGSHALNQRVPGLTHVYMNKLYLIISCAAWISGACVLKLIGGHFAMRSFIKAHRPSRSSRIVTYRELRSIDGDSYLADMFSLPLFVSAASNVTDLLAQ